MIDMFRFYNTLSRTVEDFKPNEEGKVAMYTCGPTVYHFAHIGNIRTYIMQDVLVKSLEYAGYDVKRVMNITDVGHLSADADTGEDKMVEGAKREHKTVMEIAQFYTKAFFEDCAKLNIKTPDVVAPATSMIDEFIRVITVLIDKGYAYEAGGNIYFDTSKLDQYYVFGDFSEDVSLYGISENSRYYHSDFENDKVEVSSAYADKYRLKTGDKITLHEEFGDKKYTFTVGDIYDYPSTLAVFMDIRDFNKTFDLDEDYFTGYFSDRELDDIDSRYIASEITIDDLTKTSRQLKRSMGNMMTVFLGVGVAVIVLVVFMLAKVIIEKNSQSISMTKILGYNKREIGGIYIHTTTIVTLVSIVACIPITSFALDKIWRLMMMQYSGWIAPDIPFSAYLTTIALASASYLVAAFFLKGRINKIPLDEALKNVE